MVRRINERPSEESFIAAKVLSQLSAFRLGAPEKVAVELFAMKHCLAEGYPFVIGLALFESFDTSGKYERVPMPDLSTGEGRESHGGHAILCVGYSLSFASRGATIGAIADIVTFRTHT